MPLTELQCEISKLLACNRTEDSYLAGGAALNFEPNSIRYSVDLDYFHDSESRVLSAFNKDQELLLKNKYACHLELNKPGYIRCIVERNKNQTKIEWAFDSAWRFLPVQYDSRIGFYLHPIDSSINKLLAMAGRDEPRDYLDIHNSIKNILPLGALCWAACGKDPGFNPLSLLELLKRRGRYRVEDFYRLKLNFKVDLQFLKQTWLKALESAETFITSSPSEQIGCLYYLSKSKTFIEPNTQEQFKEVVPHFGKIGGVVPAIIGE